MRTIKTIALTEKGALKPQVRKAIAGTVYGDVAEQLAELGFEFVSEKNAFVLPMQDEAGNFVYVTLDATIGTKHVNDRAVRKTTKKVKVEDAPIVID